MDRNNTIGIVGIIAEKPYLILDALEWENKVFETKLKRMRPSGIYDEFVLRFTEGALGEKDSIESIANGVEVLVIGEVRNENVPNPTPTENRVKIFIYAEVVAVNNSPVEQQNKVYIRGNICIMPSLRHIRKGKKEIAITNIIVAVNSQGNSYYIPCVCWRGDAEVAAQLKVGTYVGIAGRLQSRKFKKIIKGNPVAYLMTTYEISVTELNVNKK